MTDTIQFYGDSISGNCYKLQLACSELGIDYRWHEIDILAGDTKTEQFRKLNPNGKVPVMVLPDGRTLPESNAILSYLADGQELAGTGRYEKAQVLQWLFFEQYSHEPYIATARFIVKYLNSPLQRRAELEARRPAGYKALAVMEQQLKASGFVANNRYSIADIALYANTHVAHEGGLDLESYPAVRDWLLRGENRRAYVPMRLPSDRH